MVQNNNEHLIPPMVLDLGTKLKAKNATLSEKFYIASRLQAIKDYCEDHLFFYNKK